MVNTETKKFKTIQVKESREFHQFSYNGWFSISKNKIDKEVADFYIFVIYGTKEEKHKIIIKPRVLIIPSDKLKEKSKNKKIVKKKTGLEYYYGFNIRRNDKAYDDRSNKEHPTDYSDYVDNWNLLKI